MPDTTSYTSFVIITALSAFWNDTVTSGKPISVDLFGPL